MGARAVIVPALPVRIVRIALAVVILVAVLVTFLYTAERTPINPFNFFGYFTIQSNLLMSVVWLAAGFARRDIPVIDYLRAFTTTYVAIVGLVYALLLAPLGAAGGVPVPWANVMMHIVVPIVAVVDWIVVGDRHPLRWRALPLVLIYPLVWIVVVLIRGATDGWFPYPFLDPQNGYGSIAIVVVAITAAAIAVGAAVFALSRVTVVRVRS